MTIRILAGVLLAILVACSRGGDDDSGPELSLVKLVQSSDSLSYKATYTYTLLGPLEHAVETTMTRVKRPPDDVRRIEVTTHTKSGEPITVVSWMARKGDRVYSCAQYPEVRCKPTQASGVFGFAQIDQVFSAARTRGGFATVKNGAAKVIAGEQATCYEAESRAPGSRTPEPEVTPRYDPNRFRIEICYTHDGILLRIHQRAVGPVPTGSTRLESVFEAIAITRSVRPDDVALPAAVGDEAEPSPSRTP